MVYMSSLRHLQISHGLSAPPRSDWPWLQYVIRSIKRTQSHRSCARLPITASIMSQLAAVWSSSGTNYEARLLWAGVCMALFGFLRSATPGCIIISPLLLLDVSFDTRVGPSLAQINIQRVKNDPFGKKASVFIARTNAELCPQVALGNYLALWPRPISNSPEPLSTDSPTVPARCQKCPEDCRPDSTSILRP
jgi:hypothetical protein